MTNRPETMPNPFTVTNGAALFLLVCHAFEVAPEEAVPSTYYRGRALEAWAEYVRQLVDRHGFYAACLYLGRSDNPGRKQMRAWYDRGVNLHRDRMMPSLRRRLV